MTYSQQPALTPLSTDECYQLLATRQLGRLGYVADHYPLIVPLNYALDERTIVLRSMPGSKLTHARNANVTFQVDDIDQATQSGWTVLVRGQFEEVGPEHSADILRRTEASGVRPWVPGEDFAWVRIIAHGISGRRLTSSVDREWRLGAAAYM